MKGKNKKNFPKIAIISQTYVVSQIEFVSFQNLTGESERHRYVFFPPWSKKTVSGNFDYLSGVFLMRC